MRARQETGLGNNLPYGFCIAAVNTHAGLQNRATHHISFKTLDQATDKNAIIIFTNGLFGIATGDRQSRLTLGFISDFIGSNKRLFEPFENFFNGFFLGWLFRQWTRFFRT